jgi:hypothetical protein
MPTVQENVAELSSENGHDNVQVSEAKRDSAASIMNKLEELLNDVPSSEQQADNSAEDKQEVYDDVVKIPDRRQGEHAEKESDKPRSWVEAFKNVFNNVSALPNEADPQEKEVVLESLSPNEEVAESREVLMSEENLNEINSSEPNLAQNEEARDSFDDIASKLDRAMDIVKEDIQKSAPLVEKESSQHSIARKTSKVVEPAISKDQLAEIENNPYIPESVKQSMRELVAQNDELRQALEESNEKLDAAEKNNVVKAGTIQELKEDNEKWSEYAKELENQVDELGRENSDLKIENQQLKAAQQALEESLASFQEQIPELKKVIAEKKQILDLEALDLLGRLKRIWHNLALIYITDKPLPEIAFIKDINFILDQIDISVDIVGTVVEMSKSKSHASTL